MNSESKKRKKPEKEEKKLHSIDPFSGELVERKREKKKETKKIKLGPRLKALETKKKVIYINPENPRAILPQGSDTFEETDESKRRQSMNDMINRYLDRNKHDLLTHFVVGSQPIPEHFREMLLHGQHLVDEEEIKRGHNEEKRERKRNKRKRRLKVPLDKPSYLLPSRELTDLGRHVNQLRRTGPTFDERVRREVTGEEPFGARTMYHPQFRRDAAGPITDTEDLKMFGFDRSSINDPLDVPFTEARERLGQIRRKKTKKKLKKNQFMSEDGRMIEFDDSFI